MEKDPSRIVIVDTREAIIESMADLPNFWHSLLQIAEENPGMTPIFLIRPYRTEE